MKTTQSLKINKYFVQFLITFYWAELNMGFEPKIYIMIRFFKGDNFGYAEL